MSDQFFNLGYPQALQLLWLLVPLAALFAFDLLRRQRVIRLFVARSLLDDVNPRRSVKRPMVKFAVLLAGLAMLVFAAAQPRWNPKDIELEQQGQNLLFVLDVSNSMRAHDVDPSRLDAAKAAIRTLVNSLSAGNQVGLLAYAGSAELKCPITPNYTHFLSVLERTTYNTVDVGGSNLGDAIDKATREVFGLDEPASAAKADEDKKKPAAGETVMKSEAQKPEETPNVLVVLTDGENHEGYAREMAEKAHRLGLGIYIIGLGSAAGAPIPIEVDGKTTPLKFKGQEVLTKLDDASLRKIIESIPSRSGYLAAGTSNVDLVDIYNRVIARQGSEQKRLRYTVWQEKFQLFIGIGIILIVASALINEQRPAPQAEVSR